MRFSHPTNIKEQSKIKSLFCLAPRGKLLAAAQKTRNKGLFLGYLLFFIISFSLACPQGASAHAVYVFAYSNGDEICTESYFTKKSRVRQGIIHMLNEEGQELDRGTTDDNGDYCFKAPASPGALKFVIEAGEGHRGEFILASQDRAEPSPALTGENQSPQAANEASAGSSQGEGLVNASAEEIRDIVRQELKAQMGPINRQLAAQENKTPGLREIVGGLGWVVGITGVIFWARSWPRREKKEK
ncbi:MAG: hypothetical protein LBE38_01300 [Deltaproteobacteria bacterium]|jgi:nickel transport protein|nr:hypothetical protein [Deltaproteobacteria bacterium]